MVVPGRWWRVPQTLDTVTPGTRDFSERRGTRRQFERQCDLGRRADGRQTVSPSRHEHDLRCVSLFVGDELFWLSLIDAGESQDAESSQRRWQLSQLHAVQLPGAARRHLHARSRRYSHRKSRRAGSFFIAVLVSSQNQNREWIYSQQQTTSAEGFAGQTFNTHVPHTVRATETKMCSDCHVSKKNDNNAWLAQLLLQGTNFVNFMGRYVYVAADDSLEVVVATEQTEPQAVFGSTLQKIAYPTNYEVFERGGNELKTAYEHVGNPRVLQVQVAW